MYGRPLKQREATQHHTTVCVVHPVGRHVCCQQQQQQQMLCRSQQLLVCLQANLCGWVGAAGWQQLDPGAMWLSLWAADWFLLLLMTSVQPIDSPSANGAIADMDE
jgi:hypothetical protein